MATITKPKPPTEAILNERDEWVGRATAVVEQVSVWAAAEGWPVERRTETVAERRLGTYDVPAVTVYPPDGEVSVTPVALDVIGRTGVGRVDVEATPTLSRVMLLGRPDRTWVIMTDSNVPIRQPWTRRETFAQLVSDLLA